MCEDCEQKDAEIEELEEMLDDTREASDDFFKALKEIGEIVKYNT